ncbi:GumC family protein [Dyadobacter crusticola]|uniref:GumC family protein n=1 Tax=Dyadobacter crusticola TaxID=292407 RepID=UPI00068FBBDF|nr:tyrosine-protein kinase family protein [Dyadobacter crusticola]
MNKEPIVIVSSPNIARETQPQSISELLTKCIFYWPVFVVSLSAALAIAFLYIKTTPPVYEVTAKLLIKDEKNASVEKTPLEKLNVYEKPKTVENEIEVLKSRELIGRVVKDLQLWISYTEKKTLGSQELYKNGPFAFQFISGIKDSLYSKKLEILIESKDSYSVSGLGSKSISANFKDIIVTNDFKWKLSKTPAIKNYIGKKIEITFTSPEKAVADYQKGISVSLVNKLAPVVELSIDNTLPERGKDILNSLMRVYNESSLEDKNRITMSTLKFIDNRLSSLTGELVSVEKSVEGFKSSRGVTDISSEAKVFLQNVQSNDTRLNDVNVQLDVISGIEQYVASSSNAGNPPATLGISDPGLVNLVEQLSAFHLQKNRLLATTPEENPIFEPLNRQIKTTENAIRANVRAIKGSLLATKAQLQGNNYKFEKSIKNIPGQERQYTSIKRQQEIKENLYVYLLQKKEEIALSYASTLNDAKIVESAYSDVPKSPKKPLALAIALLFGLVVPAGSIFAIGILRGRINNRSEIENTVSIPVISEISHQKGKDPLISGDKSNSLILEQFRALRTRLQHIHSTEQHGRVTLFTSSVAGEGKSFAVSNLGISLAASDRKTIILELDLRRPKIASLFKLPANHPGISEYLRGEVMENEIIQTTKQAANLFVIGCGEIPENPSELLENGKLEKLIDYLKQEFDDILIDTPPVHLVSDALIIDYLSEATMYIIRQGFTSKNELAFIEELNKDSNFKNMNIIFNGINRRKHGYGYKYDTAYYR